MDNWGKLKIKRVGTFELSSFEDLESVIKDLEIKFKGKRVNDND